VGYSGRYLGTELRYLLTIILYREIADEEECYVNDVSLHFKDYIYTVYITSVATNDMNATSNSLKDWLEDEHSVV
jgi:hypothetical protein